jgi:hypothetical protein
MACNNIQGLIVVEDTFSDVCPGPPRVLLSSSRTCITCLHFDDDDLLIEI